MSVYIKADQRFWREGGVLIPHGFMSELEEALLLQEQIDPAVCQRAREFYDYAYATLWLDEESEWPPAEEHPVESSTGYHYHRASFRHRFAGVFGEMERGLLMSMATQELEKTPASNWGGWGKMEGYKVDGAWSLQSHPAFSSCHWFVSALAVEGDSPETVDSSPGEMERGVEILKQMEAKLKAALPWIAKKTRSSHAGELPMLRAAKSFSKELSELASDLPKNPLIALDDEGLESSRYAEQGGWAVFYSNKGDSGFLTGGPGRLTPGSLTQARLFENEPQAKREAARMALGGYALVEVEARIKSIGAVVNINVEPLRGAISAQEKKQLDQSLNEQELEAARAGKLARSSTPPSSPRGRRI